MLYATNPKLKRSGGLGIDAEEISEPSKKAALLADRMLFSDMGDTSLGAPKALNRKLF